VFNTLRSHSALGELSKSGGLAVECQNARLEQVPLIPASAALARQSANWELAGNAEIRSVNSPPLAEREFLLLTRCLEDRERRALRICHHSHAANIFNLHWRHVEFRTKAFRLCGYLIAI